MEEIIINIAEEVTPGDPANVEMKWSRWDQAWIITVVDAIGSQIGSAEYVYKASGREFAEEIRNDMYDRYVVRKEERE